MDQKIKIGVSPLSWMNSDIPKLGRHIAPEQCLIDAASIGYEGIELEDPFRKIIDTLPSLLKKYGLSLIGGWHSTFLLENSITKEKENLKRHMDLLDSLGARIVNMAECSRAIHRNEIGLSQKPVMDEEEWKYLCESLDELAFFLQTQEFTSAYHYHVGTVIQNSDEIEKLMDNTSRLGLLFDSGHLRFTGVDPIPLLKKYIHRVRHVHAKNIRPSVLENRLSEDASFFSAILSGVFTVPGDVKESESPPIDFEAICDILLEHHYNGWIVVEAEQDPKKAPPYPNAKLGYETITKFLMREKTHF